MDKSVFDNYDTDTLITGLQILAEESYTYTDLAYELFTYIKEVRNEPLAEYPQEDKEEFFEYLDEIAGKNDDDV